MDETRGAQRPFRFYLATLGCPKNTVDANGMAVLLQRAGYQPTMDPDDADLIIVNTCGFIELAREESLETLEDLALTLRPEQRMVAAGCWAQRDPEALQAAVPEIDAFLGTRSWAKIVELADELLSLPGRSTLSLIEDHLAMLPEEAEAPGYVISGPSAFLKISEGCSRECAFCAIPAIKGPSVSRSVDAILADARQLADLGALEINLIAQDVTYYGYDLGMRDGLATLLERLTEAVPDVPWIRLLYAFPGYITPRLVDVIHDRPQVLPYIDLPLQHAHPDVLRRMRRPSDMDRVRRTLRTLRERLPEVVLRTTLIVGFPGETAAEFETLLDFVREVRFDRLGVFEYSHEPGTTASTMVDDVPDEVKSERYEAVMVTQQAISREKNLSLVGKRLPVLLEGTGDDVTVGRSYRDAPEIDGLVLIQEELEPHRLVDVEVTEALVYDLVGRVVQDEV
ncbi:MAG: 30S ribosomal protein S12 methylthiotransferase RimO [Anaerolineae bacterium]